MNKKWELMDEKAERDHIKAVKTDYDLTSNVWRKINKSNEYEIKIASGEKEVIIREVMKKGLTDFVVLTIGEETRTFKKYKDAEVAAIEYLKGENGDIK